MPINLSIKNVPDQIAERLRRRAARHHRSLQGELLAVLEEAVTEERSLTPAELLAEVRAAGLKTPAEAAGFVRRDRDARSSR
jgi:plasmid stability protein